MKKQLLYLVIVLYCAGCMKDTPFQPVPNKTPKTFFWIIPDSTIREGQSKQHLRWWGEDPDGIIKGYLFAADSFPISNSSAWRWTTITDTFLAFPLLKKRDTFNIAVRSVDNTFQQQLPRHAIIRLSSPSYWDINGNGIFDSTDILLPTISGAVDPNGANQPIPLLNTPPTIDYAANPNDAGGAVMQQPETTFTAVTFAWEGADSDGVETISQYEFALNDTTSPSGLFKVSAANKLISLVVPRSRSDNATGTVDADVYSGTYATTRQKLGTIHGMKLDTLNKFFVRSRDIAGDSSAFAVMPRTPKNWYVKKPVGKLLIVNDYLGNDKDSARIFYNNLFPTLQGAMFDSFSVLNIGRGKRVDSRIPGYVYPGDLVPPFIDPALSFTLHLFDVVFWYTEPNPSLNVAQLALSQYVQYDRFLGNNGKVIFSTMFKSASDPRGALREFAPIDSIGSADLIGKPNSGQAIFPRFGDDDIPVGYQVYSDSLDVTNLFPPLRFNFSGSRISWPIYMRPIYKRADARYIYHIQDDVARDIPPITHYSYLLSLQQFTSISAVTNQAWVCGPNGTILHTTDQGQQWANQPNTANHGLESIFFLDANNGWCAGDSGTILQTVNGGDVWNNRYLTTFKNFNSVHFVNSTTGIIAGSSGSVFRSTDGGVTWDDVIRATSQTLRSVHFSDPLHGIAVGDTGTIIKTTDGGLSWLKLQDSLTTRFNCVRMLDSLNIWIVGTYTNSFPNNTNIIKSTDGGTTWVRVPRFVNSELRSISFVDANNGYVCGVSGAMYLTNNGGTSWTGLNSGVTQNLNSMVFTSPTDGWAAGGSLIATTDPNYFAPGGGVVLRTGNAGSTWNLVPHGTINVAVIDGYTQGEGRFAFIGLPLHLLNGDGLNVKNFFEYVLFNEFGF